MLNCTFAAFIPIRRAAQIKQAAIATKLLQATACENLTAFIQNLCHASWISTPQTTRIWLGTWQLHTLRGLLGNAIDKPLSLTERYRYITAIRKLTAPLLQAYHSMININTQRNLKYQTADRDESLPLYEYYPHQDTADTEPTSRSVATVSFTQDTYPAPERCPSVMAVYETITHDIFALSDAAFSVESADRRF